MNHFNLLMVLQTLVDFFEGYFLQQFYGDFFAERFRRKSWNQMGVVIAYVMFQYIKKLFLPTDYRMFYITENLILTFFFLLFLGLCFYKNIGLISIFLVVSFMSIQESDQTRKRAAYPHSYFLISLTCQQTWFGSIWKAMVFFL